MVFGKNLDYQVPKYMMGSVFSNLKAKKVLIAEEWFKPSRLVKVLLNHCFLEAYCPEFYFSDTTALFISSKISPVNVLC